MKAFIVCVIAATFAFQVSVAIVCPPNACDSVDCSSAMDEVSSCQGRVDATGGYCGCCPACIQQLNEGDQCMSAFVGLPTKAECSEGLRCHPISKKCVKKSITRQSVGACQHELDSAPVRPGAHRPQCDENGEYQALQCRESVCMCVDSEGKLAGNYFAGVEKAADMSCKCAREAADYRKTGMVGKTFNCDSLGNYQPYRCVGSVCFCIDEEGKQLEALPSVSISELSTLNCEPKQVGACQQELESLQSGPVRLGAHKPQCDENGEYHPRQCRESVCNCVDSNGQAVQGYQNNVGYASQMSCKCAREQGDYQATGMVGKTFNCDQYGNYQPYRCVGSVCFCVDEEGKQLEALPSVSIAELSSLNCNQRLRRQDSVGACQHKVDMIMQNGQPLLGARIPQCEEDGSFKAVQCFESRCACVDTEGKPTGHGAHVSQSSTMTCNCARDQAEYMKTGMVGKMFNCDRKGNYQQVQCLGSVCHCVDEKGIMLGEKGSVSISNIGDLQC